MAQAPQRRPPQEVVAAFLVKVKASTKPIYVGIDPGASGAISLVCGRSCVAVNIPTYVVKSKKVRKCNKKERLKTGKKTKTIEGKNTHFDYRGICDIFRELRPFKTRIIVALEEVPTTLGPGRHHADIMLNRAYAIWPLFLYSRGYRQEPVKPNAWKPAMGLRGKDKSASLVKALQLFPGTTFETDDQAEAVLIAEYTKTRAVHDASQVCDRSDERVG